jgi:hypothetical protein
MGKLVGGILLLMVSAFMLIGFLLGGGEGQGLAARIAAFIIACVLPGAGGGWLLYLHRRGVPLLPSAAREQVRRHTFESEVLKLAQARGGRLTVVEVIAETAMGAEAAEEALRSLAERGIAEVEVTESGLIVYTFYDVQRLKDKSQSRGLLDA